MKIASIQLDMPFAKPDESFAHTEEMMKKSLSEKPDVIILPETWNTGFFPKENLHGLCDSNGSRTKKMMSNFARKNSVNIVAGSVANSKNGKIYNTSYVFDREGSCIAEYDKTHLFTPMGEDNYFEKGNRLCRFKLDGFECAVLICYDIRFPELTRTLALDGLDFLFLPSQWPMARVEHILTLLKARAIENQMFVCGCNSCEKLSGTVYAGNTAIFNPWGELIAKADENEEIIYADCDTDIIKNIRNSINVFRDRRSELYSIK